MKRNTTRRLRLNITDFDALARYFAKLSAKGIHFEKPNRITNSFVMGEPKDYDYFVEYYKRLKGEDREQFVDLAEAAGWERVYSDYDVHYFRAPAGTATSFYTDKPSLIERYQRIMRFAIAIALTVLFASWFFFGGNLDDDFRANNLSAMIFHLFGLIVYLCFFAFSVKAVVRSALIIHKLKKDG